MFSTRGIDLSRRTWWILTLAVVVFAIRAPEVVTAEMGAVEFYATLGGGLAGSLLVAAILYYIGRGVYRLLKGVERRVADLAAP